MGGVEIPSLLSLFLVGLVTGNHGEPMVQSPQFQMQPFLVPPQQFQPIPRVPFDYRMIPQEFSIPQDRLQPILHNPGNQISTNLENQNLPREVEQRTADDSTRTAKSGYDQPSYPQAPGYGYTPPSSSYSPPASPSYSAPVHHAPSKFPEMKTDLSSLIKPVTTKVATKVSGLIGLVLTLLTGTSPDDLEMKGFKDIVINGIVKPLLIAKGGIKSLISKLTIPVISLLLINLEVLITVWWLWEECPDPVKHVYSKPTDANYNSY